MSHRRKKWLWIFGLPLFLAVVAHWGFHLLVRGELDKLFERLRPELEVSYQELETSLLGRARVSGVLIHSPRLMGPLQARNLEIQGPPLHGYLLDNNPLQGFGPPRSLRLAATGLELDLPDLQGGAGDGCDFDQGIPPRTLRMLGFQKLEGRAESAYDYQPELNRLTASFDLEISGVQDLGVKVSLQNVTPEGFRRGHLGAAALSELVLTFDVRPTFGKRLVDYCATRRQLAPAAYEAQLVATIMEALERRGVVPGPDLEDALERYVRNWGTLEISMIPPVPMNLVFLPFVPGEQLQQKLGLEVFINGEPIRRLRFGLVRTEQGLPAPEPAASPRLKPFRKHWAFREVAPERLQYYLGHRVRLQERGDPPQSGLLMEVADGRATVQQWIDGGKFMAHLSLAELVRSEVWVREGVGGRSAPEQVPPQDAQSDDSQSSAEPGNEGGREQGAAQAAE